ncbi:hypothetical protein GF373_07370 [bacterium]|nr:hypothetical protein [bacterium]
MFQAVARSLFPITLGACVCLLPLCVNADTTVEEIRREALKPPRGEAGRPLPLAAHWNVRNWDPFYQNRLIRAGHHILPWLAHPAVQREMNEERMERFYKPILTQWAAWKLPFTLRDGNWLSALQKEPYKSLPPRRNPLTIKQDNSIGRRPSPLGPAAVWREAGAYWTDHPAVKRLQEYYPAPPFVMFLSNNETRKLRWHELGESLRFQTQYKQRLSEEAKRELVAAAWIERYNALHKGMLDGLVNAQWKQNAMFVGYNAFGPPSYARWPAWHEYAMATPARLAPQPLFWDGGSPSSYDNNWQPEKTDYRVWSPQVEAMNFVFMWEEALRLNPDFWLEISLWDGDRESWGWRDGGDVKAQNSKPLQYIERGQDWTPARYQGRVQFVLWLLRPRSVREFRGHVQPRENHPYEKFWLAVLDSVDAVWASRTLTRFWRHGELVPNRAHKHPWQSRVVKKYEDADRWFLLDTNLDPPRPWANETELPVFSLALQLGEKPNREWLVYAYSPLEARRNVEVEIPHYKNIMIDVSIPGAFYTVDEKGKIVKQLH